MAITYGTASEGSPVNDDSLAWSQTVAAGSNRLLVVFVSSLGVYPTDTTVTYDDEPLTLVRGTYVSKHAVGVINTSIWYLVDPPVGTANVQVTIPADTVLMGSSLPVYGINQSSPIGSNNVGGSDRTTVSTAVSSQTGQVLVCSVTAIPGDNLDRRSGSQTVIHTSQRSNPKLSHGSQRRDGAAGSTTGSWEQNSAANNLMVTLGVMLNPSGGSSGGSKSMVIN